MNDPGSMGDTRFPVPGRGWAVVTVWAPDGCTPLAQEIIDVQQRVVLGRAPEVLPKIPPGTRLMTLPQDDHPLISRAHLVVEHGDRGWRFAHLRDVRNLGWIRQWGDLNWIEAGPGTYLSRHGLLAYRFPGEPHHVLTVTAPQVRQTTAPTPLPVGARTATRVRTEDRVQRVRVGLNVLHLEALVKGLPDAVMWPPAVADGRVRPWESEAIRKNYERLKKFAAQMAELDWADGARGADPLLLRKLIDVGEVTYADVYGLRGHWPAGGLMPTHHTHTPEGRRML